MSEANARRAQVITALNLKGGVGKTHMCWLLAAVCQERGLRCLIVDLDPQANITQSFIPHHSMPTGVERIFDPAVGADPASLIKKTNFDCIDLIPVTGHFARYELSQSETWEANRLYTALADALAEILPNYDYILLDCPPRISLASYAALCASDYLLIPLEAADWGARGTATVRAILDRVQQAANPNLKLLGYIVSKFKQARAFQLTYLAQIRQAFGDHVFETVVPDLARFERSVDEGIPITLHSPTSHAARIARHLFDEVESRIGQEHGRSRRPGGQRSAPAHAAATARR